MLETLPVRGPETEEYYQEIDKAMPTLREAGIDIQAVMAKRNEIRTAVNSDINGQHIRIPGYLLPLEVSGANVTEFLLVPYVGACIHVPPPPPNQIVHVKVIQKKGYKNKNLYDPVWVTGVISAQSMVKDLYLVDGSTGVDIGFDFLSFHRLWRSINSLVSNIFPEFNGSRSIQNLHHVEILLHLNDVRHKNSSKG